MQIKINLCALLSKRLSMPVDVHQQTARREAIRDLLSRESVRTQAALMRRLREHGHSVTQSSISRDLRELRVVKNPDGYRLPTPADSGEVVAGAFEFVKKVSMAGANLVVVHTAIGAAQRVAVELDRTDWPEIVGTVSGDDTIFVATTGTAAGRMLQERLTSSAAELAT